MSRRRTKTERELIADLMDSCKAFCNTQECKTCPLRQIQTLHEWSCIRAYAQYILGEEEEDDK
jgi:hypothetical protein